MNTTARLEDENRITADPGTAQAPRKGQLHVVLGPVGAGKSTFGLRLAGEHLGLRLTLDEWMEVLFRPDRPADGFVAWYVERAARCLEQIWTVTRGAIDAGTDVVLEPGLVQRRDREPFFRRVAEAGLETTIYVLDAAKEVRRERVAQRNRTKGPTFSMVVPPAAFELASNLWEPLDAAEREGRDVRFVRTD